MDTTAAAGARPSRLATVTWGDLYRGHGPIALLMFVGGFLRAFHLGDPEGAIIGDETWYVQAARVLAGFPVLAVHLHGYTRSFFDTNREHPPLAKVIMAASMRLLGNTEIAWRLPSVILGTLTIPLIYGIVLKLRGTRTQALVAAFILTFDNLCLVHGRIATLDIYFVFFILAGTLLWVSSYLELAGVVFAIATLCKTNALLGLFTMLLYEGMMAWGGWRSPSWPAVRRLTVVVAIFVAFFLLGLGALDGFFTDFTGPIAHLKFMASFHAALKSVGASGAHSVPFQWWLNLGAFKYYTYKISHHGVVTKEELFQAAMNGYVLFVAPLAMVYAVMKAWTVRSPLATFAVASLVGNFLPIFMAWAVMSRTSYIYYMLPIIPALACGIAVAAGSVPSKVRWGFVVLVLYAFVYQYPIRRW